MPHSTTTIPAHVYRIVYGVLVALAIIAVAGVLVSRPVSASVAVDASTALLSPPAFGGVE
jgi:hypothetical protein